MSMKINSSTLAAESASCQKMRKRSLPMRSSAAENTAFQVAAIKKAAIKLHLASRIMTGNEAFLRTVTESCVVGFDEPAGYAETQMATYAGKLIADRIVAPEDLCVDAIVQAAYQLNDVNYVVQWVREKIRSLKFSTEKTAAIQADIAAAQVRRYCLCEGRIPLMVYCPQHIITMASGALEVATAPDMIFGGSSVEAVKIRTGKPDIVVSSRSKSVKKVDDSLEMYAMLQYAHQYALSVYGTSAPLNVSSSYYFLRRDDDTASKFDNHFFPFTYKSAETGRVCTNSGHNVVTLTCVAGANLPGDVTDHYEALAKAFGEGVQCTEDMCASCPRNELCNYRKAPIASQNEKPRLKANEIQLSPAQEKVIEFRKGVARVNAGAGAGKTLVVALRTAYMISEGIDPASMLLITFTNAGADEMKERIMFYMDDLGIDTEGMNLNVTTFNAFGNSIIVSEYERLGFAHEPRLIDDIERKSIIRSLLNDNVIDGLDYRNFTMNFGYARGALSVVSELFAFIKKNRLSIYDGDVLEAYAKEANLDGSVADGHLHDVCEQTLRLYLRYDAKLKADCLIEYADQEGLVFDLLDMDPYYFDTLGIAHITVDEYQDTSESQNDLVKKLCQSESFESLLAVGDDSQSIFSFRDANPENIVNFFEKFGPGEDLFLVENYRCSPEIIDFANRVNSRNRMRVEKDLIATRSSQGIPVKVVKFENRKKNYEWIADSIAAKIKAGTAPSDIEIQAATKAELLEMASVLTSKGIETFVSCPEPMLDNSRIKGIIAMNAAIANPRASKSIIEYLNALCDGCLLEMSDSEIESLEKEYEDKFAKFQLLSEAEKADLFDDRAAEIAGGDDVAINFVERLQRFSRIADKSRYIHDFIDLGGEMLKRTDRLDGVTLSTVHSSKGLEWPIVYIIQTKFVSAAGRFDEERRRLLFVAATRARDELFVTGLEYLGRGKSKTYNVMLAECEADANAQN